MQIRYLLFSRCVKTFLCKGAPPSLTVSGKSSGISYQTEAPVVAVAHSDSSDFALEQA